ncbi:hypothetical protein K4F52_004736 [Lecanicillium sp. MT-2017a]|nr:hypothetical protein K4F52_004736 [Lecanicillium sp. MT-2017a]
MLGVNLKSLRGVGYFVLQALRVATVITLAAACAACWVLIVKVEKERTYFVFACASLAFTSIVAAILIFSEFPVVGSVKEYFRTTWPVLSESHGLGWLGFATIMIGCNVLGTLNQPGYSKKELGGHFSGLVEAAGILCLTFGGLNILCALVWRDSKESITSRDIRANGNLANQQSKLPSYSASPSSSLRNEKTQSKFRSMFWKKPEEAQSFLASSALTLRFTR